MKYQLTVLLIILSGCTGADSAQEKALGISDDPYRFTQANCAINQVKTRSYVCHRTDGSANQNAIQYSISVNRGTVTFPRADGSNALYALNIDPNNCFMNLFQDGQNVGDIPAISVSGGLITQITWGYHDQSLNGFFNCN